MDKTASQRRQRFREQIARAEANKLDDICTEEGISKTYFVRNAIESWFTK